MKTLLALLLVSSAAFAQEVSQLQTQGAKAPVTLSHYSESFDQKGDSKFYGVSNGLLTIERAESSAAYRVRLNGNLGAMLGTKAFLLDHVELSGQAGAGVMETATVGTNLSLGKVSLYAGLAYDDVDHLAPVLAPSMQITKDLSAGLVLFNDKRGDAADINTVALNSKLALGKLGLGAGVVYKQSDLGDKVGYSAKVSYGSLSAHSETTPYYEGGLATNVTYGVDLAFPLE